ncbi:MAG: hypothetical protein AMS23_06590 [Bacteroides sp. SM1_62]|nr:MAG: hypothetical protein AMS23_06590 [Bacteroides sp. SM1_62]
MKEIRTEIIINTSKEKVWSILTNLGEYPDWNPFIRSLEGQAVKDTRLVATFKLKDSKPMIFKPVVTVSDEKQKFEWLGTTPLKVFNGRHYFIVEEIGEKQVRFVQGEQFTGILAKPFYKRFAEPTQKGFVEMNKALKDRAEYLSNS